MSEIKDNEIQYVESAYEAQAGLKYFVDSRLIAKAENITHMVTRIGMESGQELAPEVAEMVRKEIWESVRSFKGFCEAHKDENDMRA